MTTNVRKLLDEIRQSRESVENDQRDCQNAIQQLHIVKKNVQSASKRLASVCNENKEAEEYHASQSAELSYVKIQDKVVAQALTNVNKELNKVRHELRNSRKVELEASRSYLKEAVEFGRMWNCSEFGEKNRHDALVKQRDDMIHRKNKLEFELREFLTKLSHLKEAQKESEELEKQYLDQEELTKMKEDEAYKLLQETDEALEKLQMQYAKASKQFEEDEKRLARKLAQSQQSVLFWERRVAETQKNLQNQTTSVKNTSTTSSKSSSSVPSRGISNNNTNNNNMNNSTSSFPKPSVVGRFFPPASPSESKSTSTTNYNYTRNQSALTATSSNFSSGPKSIPIPTSTQLQQQPSCSNIPSSNRVFQFKKKSSNSTSFNSNKPNAENNNPAASGVTIPGPSSRSVPVTLGTTPYSTFQSGRQLLNPQNHNNVSFNHR